MEMLIGAVLGIGVAVVVALLVPWVMPALDPVFRLFDRYVDWVEHR